MLTDSDLKVGGQWAFNLYDRMIPQFLKKYGKKFGAKVEDVEVRTTKPSPDTTVMIPRDFVLREEYSYDFDVDEYSLLNREGVSVAGGETAQDAVMAARQAGLFEGETLVPVEVEPADVGSDFPSRLSFKAIDITPQMRGEEGVLGGQVRFMPAGLDKVFYGIRYTDEEGVTGNSPTKEQIKSLKNVSLFPTQAVAIIDKLNDKFPNLRS